MGDDGVYDVAVVGAGINGAAIARDAALRGLSVVVLEQNDLGSGTSAISSRLIHGGLRYLEHGEISLVFESLRERRILRHTAPHLVRPIRICIPIYTGARRGPLTIRLGMILYDLLSVGKAMPSHDMLNRDELLEAEPGIAGEGLRAAARYYDAQVVYAERLVLENLLAAKAAAADIRTYSRVTHIGVHGGNASTVEFVDTLTQQAGSISAAVVVNAAGPWVDRVLAIAGRPKRRYIGGTKGSHLIVDAFPGAPKEAFYVEAAADGRPIFIIPWNGLYLIGTTDIRYDGDLDEIRASPVEIDYLLAETNRVFPGAGLGSADIRYAYAGVRPLPWRDKGPESAITRRHIIKRNRRIARNLLSIIGGKLTTHRSLAEQAVDRIARVLGRKLPECRTRETLLPGAYRLEEARAALEATPTLSGEGVERLMSIYGGRVLPLLALCGEGPLARTIDGQRSVLAAEVAFAIREEMARELTDIVHRRLMVGLAADQGRPLYEAVAAIAAAEFGWDDAERHAQLAELRRYSDSLRSPVVCDL